MASIRLQFSLASGFGPWMIRWFDRGIPFSHVDAVLPDGRLIGAHSRRFGVVPPGVQIRDHDYEPFVRRLPVELPTSEKIAARFYEFLHQQIGKPFDTWGEWAFLFNRDWRDDSMWFCSEMQTMGLEVSKYFDFPLAVSASKVTPGDLLMACSTRVPIDLRL